MPLAATPRVFASAPAMSGSGWKSSASEPQMGPRSSGSAHRAARGPDATPRCYADPPHRSRITTASRGMQHPPAAHRRRPTAAAAARKIAHRRVHHFHFELAPHGTGSPPPEALVIRRLLLASCAWAAVVASPAIAAAQRAVFVEGLSELTARDRRYYGDEGARVGPALDKMAGGLAEWDRAIQAFESRLTSELPRAQPRVALQMRVTLGENVPGTGPVCRRDCESSTRPAASSRSARMFTCFAGWCSTRPPDPTEAGEAFRSAWALDASDPITAYHVFRHAATTGNTKECRSP